MIPKVHFREDTRYVVIAECCGNMPEAEKAVDAFLREITETDEAAATYQRVAISGVEESGNFVFEVVVQ